MKKVIGIILILSMFFILCGCSINYEEGVPILQETIGEAGIVSYDSSSQHYVVDVYFEGLCDTLTSCILDLNGNLQPWREMVNSANVMSRHLSLGAPYGLGVTVNYYDTNGTLMISSHAGYVMYDAATALISVIS